MLLNAQLTAPTNQTTQHCPLTIICYTIVAEAGVQVDSGSFSLSGRLDSLTETLPIKPTTAERPEKPEKEPFWTSDGSLRGDEGKGYKTSLKKCVRVPFTREQLYPCVRNYPRALEISRSDDTFDSLTMAIFI